MTNNAIIEEYKILNEIEEEMHTFQAWLSLGYKIKKGEKAKHKFPIWKQGTSTYEEDGEEKKKTYMFMKMSAFFTESQVEKVKEEKK